MEKRQRKVKKGEAEEPAPTAEPEGELRPLVKKARSRNAVLRGEDYWVDVSQIKPDKPKAPPKELTEDQFKKDKLKEEIVSPYTQNYPLLVILAIAALVVYIQARLGDDAA
jgi:hypothetical protein